MFSFALGTLPAVLLSGLVVERVMVLVKHKLTRTLMGVIMIIFGVWTIMNNHATHQHSKPIPNAVDSIHLEHQHH
jgi:sulfite exporter TauE/SafE